MVKIHCSSCGAPLVHKGLGNYICEYCGSKFHEDNSYEAQRLMVQTIPAQFEVFQTKAIIPREKMLYMGNENAAEMAKGQMVKQLADALFDYMTVETSYDPCTMNQTITGKVRVVKPDYRFV